MTMTNVLEPIEEINNYNGQWFEHQDELIYDYVEDMVSNGYKKIEAFEDLARRFKRTIKAVQYRYNDIIIPKKRHEEFLEKNSKWENPEDMKKRIILSNGVVKHMTFEEILVQFKQMIEKFAYLSIEKIIFNKPEKEDVLQELRLQTWEAYKRYNGVNAFSTYLVPRLQHGIHRATMKLYAKKRTNEKGVISLNKLIAGGEGNEQEFEGLLGEEDLEITSLAFRDLMQYLEKTLEPSEKTMLKSLLDKDDFSIQNLADELGMSRQGANKKYNKFREKMAKMMLDRGYAVC